jgi:IPT/TIG domain
MRILALALSLFSCAALAATLSISSLSPTHGPAGTVVTITGVGFTGTPHVALVTAQTDMTYTVVSDTTVNYTVSALAQLGAQPLQIFNNALEAEATFTVDAPTTVTPPVASPAPRCMVDAFAGNFHTETTALGDTVALLWCDDQIGLDFWAAAGTFNLTLAPPACLTGLTPSWSFQFLQSLWNACTATSGALNEDQDASLIDLKNKFMPRLVVAGPSNQNLYTMNADGTKGPQLVIGGFGMQVAPGTPCMGKRLLLAGARYHQLGGKTTTNGQVIPPNTFAICTISYPPSSGFTSGVFNG